MSAAKWRIFGLIFISIIGAIAIIVGTGLFSRSSELTTYTVSKIDSSSSVFVTGEVKPIDEVDLAFNRTGRIATITAIEGDRYSDGALLASLDTAAINADLLAAESDIAAAQANLESALADYDREQRVLEKLQSGNREEEVRLSEIDVIAARNTLEEEQVQLELTIASADAEIQADYRAAVAHLIDAADDAKNALIELTDIQYTYFAGSRMEDSRIRNAKEDAISALFGIRDAGNYNRQSVSALDSGLYDEVFDLVGAEIYDDPSTYIERMISAVQAVFSALDSVELSVDISDADVTILDAEKSLMSSTLSTLIGDQSAIASQIANNDTNIANGEIAVTAAELALEAAEEALVLSLTGSRDEDIAAQEAIVASRAAIVRSREASVAQAVARANADRVDIRDSSIRAPFAGTVASVSIGVGETAISGTPAITYIAEEGYEVEALIPELNIGRIQNGMRAKMTFDAFPGEVFMAEVGAIDPIETLDDGLTTYGVSLYFDVLDERILPGMTADIEIITESILQELTVPAYAIIEQGGSTGVLILIGDLPVFREVELGTITNDGQQVVLGGLAEGDVIVIP